MVAAGARHRVIEWLRAGDPAIRWQVERDLLTGSANRVEREQRAVASSGWGARLLAKQDPAGTWAGRMYTPKWISTTYTLLLLRQLGLPAGNAQAVEASNLLLERGRYEDGGISFGWGRSETCVTGMVLSITGHFLADEPRLDGLVGNLLAEQMDDGGWNCQRCNGATHSSMHTTILVLEGLLAYERCRARRAGKLRVVRAARRRGMDFLLDHRLFRSHRTGKVIKADFLRLTFPPQWHYDILRALDFFRAVDARRDDRLRDAIERLIGKRRRDGRWNLERLYPGKYWFHLEQPGRPSRWNTLRALRVLDWWAQ